LRLAGFTLAIRVVWPRLNANRGPLPGARREKAGLELSVNASREDGSTDVSCRNATETAATFGRTPANMEWKAAAGILAGREIEKAPAERQYCNMEQDS
jgi:hypothetical protein